MKLRHVCLLHQFRRRICPHVAGWLIVAQVLPLARLEARTPPSPPAALAVEWTAPASDASVNSREESETWANVLPADALLYPSVPVTPAPPVAPETPPSVTVNRIVPAVTPPVPFVGFSASPSDQDFLRGRLFGEPLVPIGRATTREENRALARALDAYRRGTPETTAPIDAFLRAHRDTPWRASLLVNIGGQLRDAGAYTRALAAWDEAWTVAKHATEPHGRDVADLAVAEWLMLSMSLMKIDDVDTHLAAIARRDVRGSSGTRIAQVRQRLISWRAHPEQFVPAEARALERLASFARKGQMTTAATVSDANHLTTLKGKKANASRRLGWLIGPAKRLGLALRAMRRSAGAPFAAGSLVSLKNGHVLALLDSEGDRFTAYDAVLNRDLSVTRTTLDDEASAYALMPGADAGAAGWTEVDAAALPVQSTQCPPGTPDNHEPKPPCCGSGGGGSPPPGRGMPMYGFHHSIAALVIQDTPVTYSVPRGWSPSLSVSYSSRSVEDPAIFTFSNLGPKWRFDWRAYIQERPLSCWTAACVDPELRVVLRGGGFESHEPPLGAWTTLGPHWRSHAIIVRTSSSPLTYERRLPDGSKEVYSVSEGTFDGARLFLSDVVDPQGHTIHLTYDEQFRIVSLTDAIGQVTTLAYEHSSDPLKITKITDPFGRFATFTYNAAGQLASITDVIGLTSTFEYGPNDFILGMTTPYGTTTFRTEDPLLPSRIYIEATDPLGGTERVEYWGEHPSLPATVPASEVPTGFTAANHDMHRFVTLYWDKRAMMLEPRALASATITKLLLRGGPDYFGGSPNTSIPSYIKRPLEGRIWYQYPNQSSVGSPSVGMGGQPSVIARVLDDGSSQISQATFNTLGHVTSETDPLGRRTSYVYAANGIDLLEVRQTTGAVNDLLVTYGNYTATHLPQTITDAAAQTVSYTYNAHGQLLTSTTPARAGITEDRTAEYAYDGNGYLQSITAPTATSSATFTYDGYGRVRTKTTHDGYSLTFDYDALDRTTKMTFPDGTYIQTIYSRLDAVTERDRLGRLSYTVYDALRRPVGMRDASGGVTDFAWCTCGSLDKLVNANGQATSWERDVQGRVTRVVRADGSDMRFTYRAADSRVAQLRDARMQVATIQYFVDDSWKQISYSNTTHATPTVSYTYDPVYNRLATMTDGNGTTTYTYYPVTATPTLGAGLLQSVDGPLANDAITYTYDELGRIAGRSINGVALTQTFDALDRVNSETNVLGTFTYGYEGFSRRLTSVAYPNGQSTALGYLGNALDRRLADVHNKRPGGATLSRFQYTYAADGALATWRQQVDSIAATQFDLVRDGENRLLQATLKTVDATPMTLKRYGYSYDKAGNRVVEQVDDSANKATVNNMNQVTSRQAGGALRFAGALSEAAMVTVQGKEAAVTAANEFSGSASVPSGTSTVNVTATDYNGNTQSKNYEVTQPGIPVTLTYDANGSLVSDGTRLFEWDGANRLTAVEQGAHRTEFTYDGWSHRVRIVEKDNGAVTSDVRLLWCGQALCEERGSTGATVTRRYFDHGMQEGGAAFFYARDHLDSVRELTDSTGTMRARYDYDPYGRATKISGDLESPQTFTGHMPHGPSGLLLAPYRAYDPGLGRWISPDPLGFGAGPNFYAYVSGMPTDARDASGLLLRSPTPAEVRVIIQAAGPAAGAAGAAAAAAAASPAIVTAAAIVAAAAAAAAAYYWWTSDDAPSDPQTQTQQSSDGGQSGGGNQSSSQTNSSTNNSDQDDRENEYQEYKRICKQAEGPPPNCLTPCEQAKWKYEMLTKCADMRQEWDDKHQPGRHADKIEENRKGAEKWRRRTEQRCK
jgi:RHS repeat-associated protein